jgi:hypothetical protein
MGGCSYPLPAAGLLANMCTENYLPWKIYSAAFCFLFVATVSLFSPFKYQIEFMKIIGANNMGREVLVMTVESGRWRENLRLQPRLLAHWRQGERERLPRTPVPVRGMLCFWIGGPPVQASLDRFYFCFDKKYKGTREIEFRT